MSVILRTQSVTACVWVCRLSPPVGVIIVDTVSILMLCGGATQ